MSEESRDWSYPIGLFGAFGIELEYMIVDRDSLDVRPICDELFRAAVGADVSDVEPDGAHGAVSWSNELVLHVVELKTQRPAPSLAGLAESFQSSVLRVNELLAPLGARLLPGAMHPWMDPHRETRLWPHENNEIYRAYDRIFGCRGHGWGNLQSTHINLPFANDEEFGRLHAALRLLLPFLPALAASSPFVDGARSPLACHRMEVYRTNSERVPMMAGLVVPEPIYTREAYEREVLGRLYEDLRPHDPEGVLRHEFANARGAMARFDRGAIEIRVLDIQECPAADVALASLVIEVARALVEERWGASAQQREVPTARLHGLMLETIRDADAATIRDREVLELFGFDADRVGAREFWAGLLERVSVGGADWSQTARRLVSAGSLSGRLAARLGRSPTRSQLRDTYEDLADCLERGALFDVP